MERKRKRKPDFAGRDRSQRSGRETGWWRSQIGNFKFENGRAWPNSAFMSDTFEGLAEFERLLRKFGRDFQTAKALVTPNIEDSLEVRSAIVGFSYHAKTEAWGPNHLAYIQRHISTISSLAGPELHFSCLCIGFLLGLFQADKITEQQFRLAETQLGGFIMLNAGKLCQVSGSR